MKKYGLLAFAIILMLAAACSGNKKTTPTTAVTDTDEEVVDTTVYGKCGDGTAMHTLQLVTDKGDTLVYMLDDTDSCSVVQGGLFTGDRVAVIGTKDSDGLLQAQKVINLTSLLGKWASIDQVFEIQEGGVVASTVKEPKPYTEWKILNGHLVLSSDTFDIYSLGPDSLYLESDKGIYGYKRMSKEVENQE